MKTISSILLAMIIIGLLVFFTASCEPGHVTVGVGVAYPGPWYGPYPRGGVYVGHPIGPYWFP
jgi:hypothetical protein